MAGDFWFDERAAQGAVNFFERLLVHVKGEWAGQPFVLQDWQRGVVRDLFGWKRADGSRRYRTAYIEVPRKNGKSTLAAGLALYLLFADGEPGAEVYSAAADRDQAAIVFDLARAMTEAQPHLMKRAATFKRSIIVPETRSTYRVLSADAYTKHGLNAHGVVVDELHAQPTRDLVDVLVTSTGARRQPLTIFITTAGFDRESVCWEYHEYARQVRDGIIEDSTFYGVIYAADEDADWLDEEVWAAANPSLGVTVKLDYLRNEARRAEMVPAYQNTFRRLHLNQWTQQESRWLPMEAWDACAGAFDERLLEGAACYGGLDLASTSDIAAFVLCFPSEAGEEERFIWLPYFWIPRENMLERARRDRVPYDAWVRQGLITATEGNVIDYGYILRDIEALGERFNIREIAFDRWGAFQVSQQLEGMGFTMVGFGQGFVSMSPPMRELLRLVLNGRLVHGGHPVLRWMADNLVVSQDAAGNLKPNKAKSREKIDGIVAGLMALDRAIRHEQPGSVYEQRGILTL
ncbi:MAG TPA: terminase large subunit [Anaerolineae bacterium]|nr:terminase large subunit [Anaerolineae bacterium]